MPEIWGIQSTPLWPSLPGQLRLAVKASDTVLSMGQIELFNHLQIIIIHSLELFTSALADGFTGV